MATPMVQTRPVLRVGIGGPVGSGKTALMDALCKDLRQKFEIAAVTNDIYTREDAEFLIRSEALSEDRIVGVETGGCPHTAIREDASMNLAAIDDLMKKFPDLVLILVESGGDNLAATFSPELADLTIYVIDVAEGEKIPRKGGPGINRSDLLVINKIDLAPHVGASLEVMKNDTERMRGDKPYVFSNLREGVGLEVIIDFNCQCGLVEMNQAPQFTVARFWCLAVLLYPLLGCEISYKRGASPSTMASDEKTCRSKHETTAAYQNCMKELGWFISTADPSPQIAALRSENKRDLFGRRTEKRNAKRD